MDDQELQNALRLLLRGDVATLDEGLLEVCRAENVLPAFDGAVSFADDGVLTMDAGLVLRFSNGTEYQLTLVRCR